MTTWRHTTEKRIELGTYRGVVCGADICVHSTPTPDPEWGCAKCLFSERLHPRDNHEYKPTRCTCGHPIEEATR